MTYESSVPSAVPEKGFYYHYKHDPAGAFNNYAYEVVGIEALRAQMYAE